MDLNGPTSKGREGRGRKGKGRYGGREGKIGEGGVASTFLGGIIGPGGVWGRVAPYHSGWV